jgi:flagellar biosynthesis protein FliQ
MGKEDQIFRWQYSNVFIALFWGMAIAMLSIAAAVEERDLWFILTYIFAVAATIWSIGAWLTSVVDHI